MTTYYLILSNYYLFHNSFYWFNETLKRVTKVIYYLLFIIFKQFAYCVHITAYIIRYMHI